MLNNFSILNRWRQKAAKLQITEHVIKKIWGLVWVVFKESNDEVSNGGTFSSFHGELLSSNIAGRARSQLDGRHLLLRIYLHNGTALYLLNFPIKMHSRYELKACFSLFFNLELFWMTNKAIIEFGFRGNRYDVIHLHLHNSSYPTQPHSLIAKY